MWAQETVIRWSPLPRSYNWNGTQQRHVPNNPWTTNASNLRAHWMQLTAGSTSIIIITYAEIVMTLSRKCCRGTLHSQRQKVKSVRPEQK